MSKFVMPMQAAERVDQLGQRIRVARIRRGRSVAELAGKAGINRNTLNALELGKPGYGGRRVLHRAVGARSRQDSGRRRRSRQLISTARRSRRRAAPRGARPRKTNNDYDF